MSILTKEIAAYDGMKSMLETDYLGKWVLIRDENLIGTYESLEDAATVAIQQFGRGPYLIREVGAAPLTLPASVMYRPI